MTTKKYQPLTPDQAEDICYANLPGDMVLNDMDDVQKVLYAELLALHTRIDEVENQAAEMMSPDKMSELATSFLGGGMKF